MHVFSLRRQRVTGYLQKGLKACLWWKVHLSNMPQRSLMFCHKGAIWSVQSKFFFDYKLKLLSYSYKKDLRSAFCDVFLLVSNSRVEVFERVSNSRAEVFQRVTKSSIIWKVLIKCLEQRFLMDGYIIVIYFTLYDTKTTFCFILINRYV